jgi:P-type Ca2+ transporter type 2C
MEWYRTAVETIITTFSTDSEKGLSNQEVEKRHKEHGYNSLPVVKQRTVFSLFISQFLNPLIYILFAAALIIFIFGEDKLDAFIISGVIFFNAILGTIQETRTKNIIESLKKYIKTESVVIRNGGKEIVADRDIVVGDIIILQEGERVPADARIIESNNMQVDEAVLTGESVAVTKNSNVISKEVMLGDRINMVFKGTYIVVGSGKAVVVAIGGQTEIGKIHIAAEEINTDIPLRKELEHLSYWILIFILVTCLFLFCVGLFTGKPIKELLVVLTALFICVVPEGLPVVLTLVLVAGALQMAKHFVLVKNMQAVEALGRTDVIVIDKTGTLTRNEMMVTRVITYDGAYQLTGFGYHTEGNIYTNGALVKELAPQSDLVLMSIAASLLNHAEIIYQPKTDLFEIKGDPTEAALFIFSKKVGAVMNVSLNAYKKIYEIPFNSIERYHAIFYQKDGECTLFIAGAPETIMARSNAVNGIMHAALATCFADGLRVVAVGMKTISLAQSDFSDKSDADQLVAYEQLLKSDIHFLGLSGIEDSIRPEVATIVQSARDAGLAVVMATGDHQATALYVAEKVGIFRAGDEYIDGAEIDQLTDDQLVKKIGDVTVFSRVSSAHKLRIVTLFQRLGKIVAMTGDGINDAPSLVRADLGIAMGNIGTEVAKQAADLVLLNDSFVTIMYAIEQGRHIFYTLKRVVLYFFSTNTAEVLIILFAFLFNFITGINLPLPLTAVQILWLNLVTDGFLDVGISLEPKEPGLLDTQWLAKKQRLVDGSLLLKMLFMAVPMAVGSLMMFLYYYRVDLPYARTMTVMTMVMFQWFNAWNCRSATRSSFSLGIFSNRWLIVAMTFVLFLQLMLVYAPFMQYIFKTVPLAFGDWITIISASFSIVIAEEVRKLVARRWYNHN